MTEDNHGYAAVRGWMMKAFLAATATIEITTGITLMALPEVFASILLESPLGTPAGVIIARLDSHKMRNSTTHC